MGEIINYDSLIKSLNKVHKNKSSLSKIRKRILEERKFLSRHDKKTKKANEFWLMKNLGKFNYAITHGDYGLANDSAREIQNYILREPKSVFTHEEKLNYLKSFNKRIKRGVEYVAKNPSENNVKEMAKILRYSQIIESRLDGSPLGLENILKIFSIGSVLVGITLLSPNLTGNTIGYLTKNSSNIFGGLLFLLGILGTFFTIKKF